MQALVLMMQEIDIQKRSNGQHMVSWGVDALDRILDDLGVYPGLCVHCYGKTGYDTREGIRENYGPLIAESGHGHREMLKHLAYYAKADGAGILVRSFMENDADDFELLHKQGRWYSPVGVGSFNYANVSFMSQIELPEGGLVSYPSMVFGMVGDASTERKAAERVFDFMRKNLVHDIGDHDDAANLFRPYTATPYAPELGWIVYVGQAGSPSSSAAITGAFRALGMKAEQFRTEIRKRNAVSVEVAGETYSMDGNAFLGKYSKMGPVCRFFEPIEEIDDVGSTMADILTPDCE